MNMYAWLDKMFKEPNKPAFPILSYPSVQLMYINVEELVHNSRWQALGMRLIADRYNMPAALGYMDLSVEAEAFGSTIIYKPNETPTVTGRIISSYADAEKLVVPEVGAGRTGIVVEGMDKSLRLINDRPVFANCIGPFSLAGRLMDVGDIMLQCYAEPETVELVLRKATDFIKDYIRAFKSVGVNGVMMAEPLAGILSPELIGRFSSPYVKEIVDELQDRSFMFIYHNCGTFVNRLIPEILATGCKAFHFGDAVNLRHTLELAPKDVLVMGNLSPTTVFNNKFSTEARLATQKLLLECDGFENFVISSGCDIPARTELECVDAFFDVVKQHYYKRMLVDMIS